MFITFLCALQANTLVLKMKGMKLIKIWLYNNICTCFLKSKYSYCITYIEIVNSTRVLNMITQCKQRCPYICKIMLHPISHKFVETKREGVLFITKGEWTDKNNDNVGTSGCCDDLTKIECVAQHNRLQPNKTPYLITMTLTFMEWTICTFYFFSQHRLITCIECINQLYPGT